MQTIENYHDNLKQIQSLVQLSDDLFRRAQDFAAERILPNRKVTQWLRAPHQRALLAVVSLLMLTSIAKFGLWAAGDWLGTDQQLKAFALSSGAIYVVEAILLIVIVSYVVQKGPRDQAAIANDSLKRGLLAENQFFRYWPYLWFSWFCLYALLSGNAVLGVNDATRIVSPHFSTAANFVNNLSAMFILAMFIELTEKTTQETGPSGQQIMPMLMVLIMLAGAESIMYAQDFYAAAVSYVFGLLSGLLVGVITGLFVAKLSSRLFNFSPTALVALTLFAVVQPVFPVLTAQPSADVKLAQISGYISWSAAFIALYAKIVLLIAIEWMRDRNGLLYYMVNQARIFENERERHMSDSFDIMISRLLSNDREPLPEIQRIRSVK